MNQEYLNVALIAFIFSSCVMSYLWYTKNQQLKSLDSQKSAEIAKLSSIVQESRGKLSVLEKQVQSLSEEKNKALQQYHSTDTLLNAAYQAKTQQDIAHKQQVDVLQGKIKLLEEKTNLAIGNYQAERRRNLIAERAHLQDMLSQLVVFEENLAATEQAFTKVSAEGVN